MKNIIIMISLFCTVSSYLFADEIISLDTREGVKQEFALYKPEKPVASVILFAGGKGILKLSSLFGNISYGSASTNFLVRTRDLFVKHGFVVAVVDAPSDKQKKKGMFGGFRNSKKHRQDIDGVIQYLKNDISLPIWLIGTSRGTESATNLAINTKVGIDGLVLTSSMSVKNRQGKAVVFMDLDKITVPTLIVSHKNDGCKNTPPEGANKIKGLLVNSKNSEVLIFEGGNEIRNPCKGESYHGFLDIEDKVVSKMAEFIKSNI